MKSRALGLMAATAMFVAGATVSAQAATAPSALRPDQVAFRALYRELVETNTTLSSGSCTAAAAKMAAHLKAAGFTDAELHPFVAPDHPQEGGLVAVLSGTDPHAKAIMLLAHIDVVEAKRADWTRDPFTLVEEGGYFYARGSSDDKAMAATWVDTLARLRGGNVKPKRTVKMALTCGEETEGAFNGAGWLATHERALIDAEFALNEGGGGQLDASGKRLLLSVEAAEKTPQDYDLVVVNPGGHSSRPVKDNAIYHLAAGLTRISQYDFPVQFNDANRAYFTAMAKIAGGEPGAAMTALLADPRDARALAAVAANPSWNAALRTTCVATKLEAGHATNALPQRAAANVNCRIFPGVSTEAVRLKLAELVADPAIAVTMPNARGPLSKPLPLTPQVMGPIVQVTAKYYPGVPVVPTLVAGATDGVFFGAVGIPTYGVSGYFYEPDLGHIHGLNERIGAATVYEGRDYLYDLVKLYADKP